MNKHNIVIFCGRLLPASETFIPAQGELLKRFRAYYFGTRYIDGITLPSKRVAAVNKGGFLGSLKEGFFKVMGISPAIVRTAKALNPALIHAHFGPCGALALPLQRALCVPMIVTYHGLDATMSDAYARQKSLSTRLYISRRASLKSRATKFIAVSEFIKRELVSQGFPEEKIVVHYIGVDTKVFSPDLSVTRKPIVLFVGRLTEKKGCEYLLQAMARVEAEVPEAELVVIGDGPLRQALEQQAHSSLKQCQFLGTQPPAIVREWMNRSKIFCVPSIRADSGDGEGFGIVFVEAQSMGLPVVSSLSGGIPEAVAQDETGFLVAERDVDGLAGHISTLLKNAALWAKFSQAGMARTRSEFDLHTQTQKLEAIYESVVSSKSTNAELL